MDVVCWSLRSGMVRLKFIAPDKLVTRESLSLGTFHSLSVLRCNISSGDAPWRQDLRIGESNHRIVRDGKMFCCKLLTSSIWYFHHKSLTPINTFNNNATFDKMLIWRMYLNNHQLYFVLVPRKNQQYVMSSSKSSAEAVDVGQF